MPPAPWSPHQLPVGLLDVGLGAIRPRLQPQHLIGVLFHGDGACTPSQRLLRLPVREGRKMNCVRMLERSGAQEGETKLPAPAEPAFCPHNLHGTKALVCVLSLFNAQLALVTHPLWSPGALISAEHVSRSHICLMAGPPECRPLKTVEELLEFDPCCVEQACRSSVPLPASAAATAAARPRLLACHDMRGGYLEDRLVEVPGSTART